jgi:hypothetical protein
MEETRFQKEIALIIAGTPGFMFGKLTYYDVFDDFHFTDTCREIIRDTAGITFKPCRIEGQQDD